MSLALTVAVGLTGTLIWLVWKHDAPSGELTATVPKVVEIAEAGEKPVPPPAPKPQPSVQAQPPVLKPLAKPAPVQMASAQPKQAEGRTSDTDAGPYVLPGVRTGSDLTSAIPYFAEQEPRVDIVEPGTDVALQEADQEEEEIETPVASVPVPKRPADIAPATPVDGMKSAIVRTSVNLRAAAKDGAKVLAVVPANSKVEADLPCRHWCAVSYKGQRGYIYKSFLREG